MSLKFSWGVSLLLVIIDSREGFVAGRKGFIAGH